MKKMSWSIGLVGLALFLLVGKVSANEGVVKLGQVNGSSTNCYVLSVFVDNHYQILGTCRGLKTPYSAEQTRYIIWRADNNTSEQNVNWSRLAEVDHGKFSVNSGEKFTNLQVTAESDWQPRKPGSEVVASGQIENLPLEGSVITAQVKEDVQTTPTPTKNTTTNTDTTKKTGGSLLGAIGRIVGTGLLILIGGVILMTVITRRKGF